MYLGHPLNCNCIAIKCMITDADFVAEKKLKCACVDVDEFIHILIL